MGQEQFVGPTDLGGGGCQDGGLSQVKYTFQTDMPFTLSYNGRTDDTLTTDLQGTRSCATCPKTSFQMDGGRDECTNPDASLWNGLTLLLKNEGTARVVVSNLQVKYGMEGSVETLADVLCAQATPGGLSILYFPLDNDKIKDSNAATEVTATLRLCEPLTQDEDVYGKNEGSKLEVKFGTLVPTES